jgi:hypothetical protein
MRPHLESELEKLQIDDPMSGTSPPGQAPAAKAPILSNSQERKLVEYLEDQFLKITRAYAKRSVQFTRLFRIHADCGYVVRYRTPPSLRFSRTSTP